MSVPETAAAPAQWPKSHIPVNLSPEVWGRGAVETLSASPPVHVIRNFLSDKECDDLIALSDGRLTEAQVVGKGNSVNSYGYVQGSTSQRTSRTCTVLKDESSFLCEKIEALTYKPREHFESPQVGVYHTGQHYAAHYDAVEPTSDVGPQFLANGGQRVCTVLVYLNTPSSGGCTSFPSLNLKVQPRKGSALVFFPGFTDGAVDTRALHCAEHADDDKWVSQVWIRETGDRRDARSTSAAA